MARKVDEGPLQRRSVSAFRPEPFGQIPPGPEKIHRLRKSAKTARALLRLAEDAGGRGAVALNHRIRDWARQLSPLRDAGVLRQTAVKAAKGKRGKTLEAARAAGEGGDSERPASWWRDRRREWARLGQAVAHYPFDRFPQSDVSGALSRAFKRVRKAERRVRAKDIRAAHEWRKRVVVLRGEVQNFAPMPDDQADALDHDLRKITRRLGRAVDWELFLGAIGDAREYRAVGRKAARDLRRTIKRKQAKAIRQACKAWRRKRHGISRRLQLA